MTLSSKTENEIFDLAGQMKRDNKTDMINKLQTLLESKNFTNASLLCAFSDSRKIFAQFTKDKKFLNKIKASDEIIVKVNNKSDEVRRNREIFVIGHDDLKKIKSLKNSESIYDQAIYLLFVSGRRTSEILNAKFEKKNNMIYTKDLVKRSKNKRDDDESVFPIIWENSPDEFIKMVDNLQSEVDKIGVKQNSFSRTVNRRIKSVIGEDWKPHSLRGSYALYNYKFNNPEKKNRNGFIRKILCHQSDSSSLAYVAFELEKEMLEGSFEQEIEEKIVVEKIVVELKDMDLMTVKELKKLCKERKMKRYSKLKKENLIELLDDKQIKEIVPIVDGSLERPESRRDSSGEEPVNVVDEEKEEEEIEEKIEIEKY